MEDIDLGTVANDGTGDTLRAAGEKINANFAEVVTSLAGKASTAFVAAAIAALNLGTMAEEDAADYLTAAQIAAAYQPLDGDLSAIASQGTTAYGRAFVNFADEATFKAAVNLEAGTDFLSPAAIAAAYQPLDSDLTAIAALATTAFGRGFLAYADAAAVRAALDLEAGTDFYSIAAADAAFAAIGHNHTGVYQPLDATLTSLAAVDGVAGDILYASGNDTWVPLAVGTDGHVLTLASGLPTWAAPAGGGGTPGGSDTQVQFNDGGSAFGGDAGLVYNKTTNLLTETNAGIGATSTAGLLLTNTTAAAAGAQQWSPAIQLTGQGWKTTATAASQPVDWRIENVPSQGTTNPSTSLQMSSQVNGGGYTPRLIMTSTGSLVLSNGATISNSSGSAWITFASSGDEILFSIRANSSNGMYLWDDGASNQGLRLPSAGNFAWTDGGVSAGTMDLWLGRRAAASLMLGRPDAASPVPQTLGVQSVVAGTADTAGANFTIAGSQGTGTGLGGGIVVSLSPAGSSGTSQNALAKMFEFNAARSFQIYNTFTDASNYERLVVLWTGNVAYIGTQAAGTGVSTRALRIIADTISFADEADVLRWRIDASGHLVVGANATYNIGDATNFVNDIYLAASIRHTSDIILRPSNTTNTGRIDISTTKFRFANTGAVSIQTGSGNLILGNDGATDFGLLKLGGTTSSFPALKRSSAILQARLADDADFTSIQGKIRTHANAVAETPTATHTIAIEDAAGTAYKVLAVAA